MLSLVLFGFSKSSSCLVLLFFFSSYFLHLSCALSQQKQDICNTLFQCGNITAGFPFWGEARPEPCGHPSLALHCDPLKKTSLIISGQMFQILQINNSANTLRLARQDFLGDSFCNATFSGITLTPELFEPLPNYKTLFVYYVCKHNFHRPANFTCPKLGLASVHREINDQKQCGASFNITVPTSYDPGEKAVNLDHLGSVLRNGFEVKLKIDKRPCQECQSTGGICAYNVATPVCCKFTNSSSELKCTSMIPSGATGGKFLPTFTC